MLFSSSLFLKGTAILSISSGILLAFGKEDFESCRRSRYCKTSLSLTWLNSSYQYPTAIILLEVTRDTNSSTIGVTVFAPSVEAMGTAMIILFTFLVFNHSTAATIVAPVANPSSTRMHVLPIRDNAGNFSLYKIDLFLISEMRLTIVEAILSRSRFSALI